MPLTMAAAGVENTVKKIGGKEETKHFLESLGFVVGTPVTIVSQMAGNLIVSVKDTRVALSQNLANKILV